MTLEEIKQAIHEGHTVHWGNIGYRVIVDNLGQYLIKCMSNGYCFGLTHSDGVTLNGDESEFFI